MRRPFYSSLSVPDPSSSPNRLGPVSECAARRRGTPWLNLVFAFDRRAPAHDRRCDVLSFFGSSAGDTNAVDEIDRMNCRADFQISVYPGPLGIPADGIPADAPPAFFLVANDDPSHVRPVLAQVEKYRQANLPVEVHIYARGGHGFNMGNRSKLDSIKGWPQRLADWLTDNGLMKK